jgi:histidinol-phosphate/aromatic aminotransferase/cobyric acid decarboxylase-like protein
MNATAHSSVRPGDLFRADDAGHADNLSVRRTEACRAVGKFPVDISLFDIAAHSPSYHELQHSMGADGPLLRDYCVPVNPYFPTPELFAWLRERLETALKYYPPQNEPITAALCRVIDLPVEHVVVANGSTELITWLDHLLVRDSLLTDVPTFGRWTDQPRETGKRVLLCERRAANGFALDVDVFVRQARAAGARAAAISNPNNPTGALLPRAEVLRLADELSHLDVLVVDESFIDFADEEDVPSVARDVATRPHLVVLKSLGKSLGLHGVRMGYAVASAGLAERLRRALPKWNVNGIADLVIRALPRHRQAYESARRRVVADRRALEAALRVVPGLTVYPSRANFVYTEVPHQVDGIALRNRLLTGHGCFIRECGNKVGSTSRHFRIAVRPEADGAYLVTALCAAVEELLESSAGRCHSPGITANNAT